MPISDLVRICLILKLFMFDRDVYNDLVSNGTIVPKPELQPPTVPMDYAWARVR